MKFDRHLFLSEATLPPSGEWRDCSGGWRLAWVSSGAAYWLGEAGAGARELQEGELLVIAPFGKGCLRASQLGEVKLHYFHFCPELLSGFLTLSERHYFQTTAAKPDAAIRFFFWGARGCARVRDARRGGEGHKQPAAPLPIDEPGGIHLR